MVGKYKKSNGSTLMEILISMAIVGILAGIAVPTYLHYTKKAHYNEIIQMADAYKTSVAACVELKGASECDGGKNGIHSNITSGDGRVNTLIVSDGTIIVTPKPSSGISSSDTYILTISSGDTGYTWNISGGACTSDLGLNCS
jgi:prepilin-type N-terminal cleavage/methylation domain-containing protein